MLKTNVNIVFFEVRRFHAFLHNLNYIAQSTPLPPLGEAVDDLDMFVAGEPEANEPLAVEKTRRLLQQRNSPAVIFDQVVVVGEDGCDVIL